MSEIAWTMGVYEYSSGEPCTVTAVRLGGGLKESYYHIDGGVTTDRRWDDLWDEPVEMDGKQEQG